MWATPVSPGVRIGPGTEWLLGNGLGGYSSGTVSGTHVRASHALLAGVVPGRGVVPFLLRLDARLILGERAFDLAIREGDQASRGLPMAEIEDFSWDPWPTWRYRAGDIVVTKVLHLVHGHHALVATFRHVEGPATRLALAPVVDAKTGTEEHPDMQVLPGRVRIAGVGSGTLTLWHDGAFLPTRAWPVLRSADADSHAVLRSGERGFAPGIIEAPLPPGSAVHLIASIEERLLAALAQEDRLGTPPPRTLAGCAAVIEADERRRQETPDREAMAMANVTARDARGSRHAGEEPLDAPLGDHDRWTIQLARSLSLGWIESPGRTGLVRSLPTAQLSGEAALRSVRGLISLRRFESAREVLLLHGQLVREGLAPSGFTAAGRPRYDAPEPSLWLVIASELFARRADQHEFVQQALYPVLEQVIERYRTGTRLGLVVHEDSLLSFGEDRPERRADLNALWYCAQAALGQLTRTLGRKEHAAFHLARARELQVRFEEVFWDEEGGCLFHAIGESGPLRGIEPTQILAASMSPPLLSAEHATRLVATMERELFTPLGLRDSPDSPRLLTEWLGPFLTAYLRANGRSAAAQARARAWLVVLSRHLERHAAGHLPVAFALGGGSMDSASIHYDGDPVSVVAAAELVRTWIEEFDHGISAGH